MSTITGTVVTPLPAEVLVGLPYPVAFQFTNHGAAPVTGITVTAQYPDAFTEHARTLGSELKPGESARIEGALNAENSGPHTVAVTLSTAAGSIPVETRTKATTQA